MKLLPLVLAGVISVSACSTAMDRSQPASEAAASRENVDAAWIEQNGPSAVPRDGWVETVSGWYRSTEACLEHRRHDSVGTPLSLAEECLETGI